ncbi:unnamed protein product [Sphagnum balticum]
MWEVISRQQPYADIHKDARMSAAAISGCRPTPMPADESSKLNVFIEQCWAQEPSNRPTAEEIHQRIKNAIPLISSHNGDIGVPTIPIVEEAPDE